jgi:hypothetical protein
VTLQGQIRFILAFVINMSFSEPTIVSVAMVDCRSGVMNNFASLLFVGAVVILTCPARAQDMPVRADSETAADAERCLATAIYYEAGREPIEGREAVAEVILNRRAHAGFPKSVCGVVYQGSQRRTGCQFTFTCDGSTARAPDPRLYEEARSVARRALDGSTTKRLSGALNYHASYVSPGWRRSLTQTAEIGLHIFYARPGAVVPPSPPLPAASAPRDAVLAVWGIAIARVDGRNGTVVALPGAPQPRPYARGRDVAALDPAPGTAAN